MKLLKYMACAGAMMLGAMAMSSCNEGSEDYVLTQTLPGCINWMASDDDSQPFVSDGVSYRLNTNYTKQQCDITIEGLALPTGQRYASLTFKDVPYTIKDGVWRVAEISNQMPESQTLPPMFSNLYFAIVDRMVGDNYYPAVSINYTISGMKLYSTLSMLLARGTTVVTSPDGNTFTQDSESPAVYMIPLDTKAMTATLAIEGAKFAQDMPSLNMEFRGIPFKFTSDGNVVMEEETLATPYTIGSDNSATPFEAAKITNFKCTADCANNMTLSFTCAMSKGQPGTEPVVYNVNVKCEGIK